MIHEVSGDILLSKAQAIAHGIAPNDPWDSGLALALREMWPSLPKDFRHYAHATHPKPGEIWVWGTTDGRRIVNLLTQDGEHAHGAKPGKASNAHVNHALRRLHHEIAKGEIKSLALPRLATGVGGLDWAEVRPLIQQHFGDLNIPVYVYTHYIKGQAAQEA
ncbi:MAG: macro domain-containing protein [Kofleriaceae bacterium]|nr:macro domain-containing protein [Kofleriaceae bacterium]